MLRQLKLATAWGAILLAFAATASPSNAGWGHHHHHGLGGWGHGHHHLHGGHFHGGRYGGSFYGRSFYGRSFYGSSLGSGLGWGYPSYGVGYPSYGWGGGGYSSLSISIGLPRYRSYYSSYGYAPSYSSYGYAPSYSSYGLTNYYAPPIYVYRPSLSAYYAPSSYYAAPSYYAPLNCPTCDPCISSPVVDCPTCDPNNAVTPSSDYSSPTTSAPAVPTPTYSTGTERNRVPSSILTRSLPSAQSMTAGGSMVDRMLGRVQSSSAAVGSLANRTRVTTPDRQPSSVGSTRTVSTASKPVSQNRLALDHSRELKPLPMGMLKSADEIFSAGRFGDAAAAYAHLTVHYGNHDELAARRFVAMVANGDCDQAAVLFELASASERPLLVSALPVGGLAELYASQAEARHRHINYLADYALKHPHDSVALAMVGTWLEMDGQPERAQPFLESARRRAHDTPSPATNPAIASRLVVTDAAR